ncbi:Transcription factor TFIIE, alpha subunit [Pyrolobus fumarii 1A]|uniref:Transcription factor E n=1 Tax=Pyrolobus fumarii (strain DSM 11204 / 1A) TaxID=694429 RepID=G0EER5_PYRF1|nr:GntR family transcriptional regulator [Pyrolobus fumarii]AEM38887.1 Transcription factor TFIIE, alpha subunit [Pyrolobus fumarii 1A]
MEQLYTFIERLYGPETREVLRILYESGQELTEEQMAEKTGLKFNVIRRALNKLMESGFVIYRKQRDPDTGRLIFYWRVNFENLRPALVARKKAVIEKLRLRLEYERDNIFYTCPTDGLRFTFDEAMEYGMICPRCGSPLEPDERQEQIVSILEEVIQKLEEEIAKEERRG